MKVIIVLRYQRSKFVLCCLKYNKTFCLDFMSNTSFLQFFYYLLLNFSTFMLFQAPGPPLPPHMGRVLPQLRVLDAGQSSIISAGRVSELLTLLSVAFSFCFRASIRCTFLFEIRGMVNKVWIRYEKAGVSDEAKCGSAKHPPMSQPLTA